MTKRVVYVSCGDPREIHAFIMDPASGALAPLAVTYVPGLDDTSNSMPLAIGRGGRELHVGLRRPPFPAVSFAIDPVDGGLREIGSAALPHTPTYIATDRSGRWLLMASYPAAEIAVFPVDAGGAVHGPAHQVAAALPKVHSVVASPDNRFVYAGCVGGGGVLCWAFDAQSGLQAPDHPVFTKSHAPGAGPRHSAFGRGGAMLYVVNEADGTVDAFARDEATGGLTLRQTVAGLAEDAHGHAQAADIHVTPDGHFLYASLRLDNSIAAFRIDAGDGTLSLIARVPVEAKPRAFAVDPDGRFLVCAGQTAAAVGVYAIDPATGGLRKVAQVATGANANWVEIIDLP